MGTAQTADKGDNKTLSTPFWEFQDYKEALYPHIERYVLFLLPFGSFELVEIALPTSIYSPNAAFYSLLGVSTHSVKDV